MRSRGLGNQVRDRPTRTLWQTLVYIFGEESISMFAFMNATSTHAKPKLTFELMIKACIDEFKENNKDDLSSYQKCDSFIFTEQKVSKNK